ncbi:Major facilitator superfamily domain general substrate transporter protein [Coniochaeta hoffmannii]|uniref:Major facilitator superfamily domain general substrate transporter protein n=1 Tax=Coniochaeta hoffmannii TaxID=91930 RepID=A0AA38RDG8_9PEZI|nr:Major facilitator superfamily domain general substrate transporter protein [Coniochaeta hoffmannii]
MPSPIATVRSNWRAFTPLEKRNIIIYIIGIMFYKFGLEAFTGSIIALATNRYEWDAAQQKTTPITFERVGLLTGLNQAFQCVGSIIIAPLAKRYRTKNVLATAIFIFGLSSAILMIVDASTGGRLKPANTPKADFSYYGRYNTDGMIPIYCITGIAYGMVELIRRIIPRDIVGGNVEKLRCMDALVHMFYEVAGTAGSFCTALALIPQFGNNFSFIITPILFTCGSLVWFTISEVDKRPSKPDAPEKQSGYFLALASAFFLFGESVWTGAKIIFSSRKYVWLLPGYTFALYGHRYLESSAAPIIARRYLGNSAWYQIMVAGSNFGELLGALFVFLFTGWIKTPIPWLRLDALLLMILWYLPYWYPPSGDVKYAWIVFATFIPVSFGWAAGDVSLAAYIQASIARLESKTANVSALGAVMAFLYSTYVVIYAITAPLLGRYVDQVSKQNGGDVHNAVQSILGVQYTLIAVCMLAASFVPKGAMAFNPKMLYGETLATEVGIHTSLDTVDDGSDKPQQQPTHRDFEDDGKGSGDKA